MSQITYPNSIANGRTVNYNYPAGVDAIMSLLGSITDSNGTVDAAYTYLGSGTIVKEDYGQAGVNLNYDPSANNTYSGLDRFGRVLNQIWAQDGNNSNVFDEYNYTYNNAGDVTNRNNFKDSSLNDQFIYDALNRLTQWKENSTSKQTWTLDALGNDLSAGSYNPANEETPSQGSSGYDLAGNMITLTSGDTAIYDAWDRLVEVKSGSTVLETCEYDGTNRRIQVCTNLNGGTVTDDYYSGQQLVESDITTNGVRSGYQYVWSPRYIDAPVLRDTLDSNGNVVAASRVFYLGDANYNVTALVSASGQVVERYSYTPYGVLTAYNSAWGNPSSTPSTTYNNTILYTGREFDVAISLYYYRARFYDAALERFVSTDPMGLKAGMNLYEYVGDSPLERLDPAGQKAIHIKFGAFIPNTLGYSVSGAPDLGGVTWQMEPYQIWNDWAFGTDDRGGPSVTGSNRVWSVIDIPDDTKVGELSGAGVTASNHAGISRRIKVNLWGAYVDGSYDWRQATLDTDVATLRDIPPDSTSIHIAAAAGYAFSAVAPDIRYDVYVKLCRTMSQTTVVAVSGTHSSFPAYELFVNGKVAYQSKPDDHGPGIWNLYFSSESFHAEATA